MEELTLEKFKEAAKKVKEVTAGTPLIHSDFFSSMCGNEIYLKPENMQFTGAYKLRGAYYKISTMTDEERKKGLQLLPATMHKVWHMLHQSTALRQQWLCLLTHLLSRLTEQRDMAQK